MNGFHQSKREWKTFLIKILNISTVFFFLAGRKFSKEVLSLETNQQFSVVSLFV